MQIYANFQGFDLTSALFGLGIVWIGNECGSLAPFLNFHMMSYHTSLKYSCVYQVVDS